METETKGRAKGGKMKNALMTPEERKAQSQKMIIAKKEKALLPVATHSGDLIIGDKCIQCSVLGNGVRVLSQSGINTTFTGSTGGAIKGKFNGAHKLPRFLDKIAIKPFISNELMARILTPIEFRPLHGGRSAFGYEATLLPEICEVILDASQAKGARDTDQAKIAETLIRGFARVGIIALVDEATGYQYDRPRRELEEQLKKFISDSLRKWVRTFPADYFQHLCRLRGVTFRPDMRLPQYFGLLTNNLVYKRLAPGLVKRLKEKRGELGKSSNKLHSWLSADTGFPEVLLHLGAVVGLMKRHTNYEEFEKELDKIAQIYPETPGLFDDPKDWEVR